MARDEFSDLEQDLGIVEKKEGGGGSRTLILAGVAVLLGVVAVGFYATRGGGPTAPLNQADKVEALLPAAEVHDINGEWIATVPSTWDGANNPVRAANVCNKLLRILDVRIGKSLTINTTAGATVVECFQQ